MKTLWQAAWRWIILVIAILVVLSIITAFAPHVFATTCASNANRTVGLYATNLATATDR